MTISEIVTQSFRTQIFTAEQDEAIQDLVQQHNYTLEDMYALARLISALGSDVFVRS